MGASWTELQFCFQELYDRYAPAMYLAAKKNIPSETFPTEVLILLFSEVWVNRAELAATQDLDFAAYLSQKLNKAIVAEAKRIINL